MSFNPNDICALANLLRGPQDIDSDSDDDFRGKMAPGDIGPKSCHRTNMETNKQPTKADPKSIWSEDEVPNELPQNMLDDGRIEPQYEIHYKQSVTAEDMFLQMGNKTPSTASCEDIVVTITLPQTKCSDIILDVTSKFLDLRCPNYKLGLHLPHPVNPQTSKAKWDASSSRLSVTLRMNREYDYVNF